MRTWLSAHATILCVVFFLKKKLLRKNKEKYSVVENYYAYANTKIDYEKFITDEFIEYLNCYIRKKYILHNFF